MLKNIGAKSTIESIVGNLIEDLGIGGFMGKENLKIGMYIVDCRMLEDSKSICDYVEKNYLGA